MSHEIRTPMNGIIGMTDLVLDTDLSEEQRDFLKIVKSSADGLITIINDILDFSKMEAGKLTLENIPFNLHGMVSSVMKQMAVRCEEKRVELICDITEDVPMRTLGDPGRIRQVLLNLLGNALKFTAKGEIELKVSLVSTDGAPSKLRFAVRDSGIGIPPEKQAAIFEAFSQADTSTTREYGGTGLGLTISNRLANLMDGHIWVDSQVGQGSTFFLEIPLQEAEPSPSSPLDASKLSGKRALIIDDNAINRRIFREMLQRWGLVVEEETSALTFLAHLDQRCQEGYDLLLVDYHMPGMDGFELIERLNRDRALSETRIIMLSSAAMPGQGARCRELGVAGYLTKPIDRQELFAAISKTLAPVSKTEPAAPPELVTRHSLEEQQAQLSILVAEDNEVNQKLIRTLLNNKGHRVTLANNGQEAIDRCHETAFDLILMDVQMPVLGGLEATQQIRRMAVQTPDGKPVPIYALSAAVLPEVRARSVEAGVDGYLTKPINRPELYNVLESLQSSAHSTNKEPRYDYLAALNRCDGEIMDIISELYLNSYASEAAKLRAAYQAGEVALVERLAHTQRGLANQFEAKPLADLFIQIEHQAHAGTIAEHLIDACEVELHHFAEVLKNKVKRS